MLMLFYLLVLTYFAATVYASVILIELGTVLAILAGLFLFVSFFLFGGLALVGVAYAVQALKLSKKKKEANP